MRFQYLAIIGLCASMGIQAAEPADPLSRHKFNDWEDDIGYRGAVISNNQLHLAGIPCGGKDMADAVTVCYGIIQETLKKFGVTTDSIIKETIYTTDIEALKKAQDVRKKFFSPGRYPAATWVQINKLYDPGLLIEFDLLVQLPKVQ